MPTVGAGNRLFTTSWPFAHFVINLAGWCEAFSIRPELTHVKGEDNGWADDLSRLELDALQAKGWDPAMRFHISLADILEPSIAQVFPPEAEARGPRRFVQALSEIRDAVPSL